MPGATVVELLLAVWDAAADDAVITHVGSTKAAIDAAAESLAQRRPVAFVGSSYPMAASRARTRRALLLGDLRHDEAVTTVLVWARRAAVRARLEAIVAGARHLGLAPRRAGLALGEAIDAARPDVLLVDLDDESATSALDALGGRTGTAIVVLSDGPRSSREDERGHVRGVLPRDAGAGEIVGAIAAVAAGLVVHHPDASRRRRPAGLARGTAEPGAPLSAREIEVLAMVADGLGNKAIAASLGISAHTAKYHVASILAKLGAASRAEAVVIGLRRGLVVI